MRLAPAALLIGTVLLVAGESPGGLRRAATGGSDGRQRLDAPASHRTRFRAVATNAAARGGPPEAPRRSLVSQRNVIPGAAGPNRLDVDVPLLSRAAADLRDLRLIDSAGRETGYLLVEPAAREPKWIGGRVLPIAATKTSSGFELDLGRADVVDRLRVPGVPAPFLKRVRVEGSGDRSRWTLLADATLFDLPDEHLRLLDVPFEAGSYRYIRLIWDDRSSARVPPVGGATARLHATGAASEPLRSPIPFRKRSSEPGKSRYRLELPGPHLPIAAIELRVANGNVYRNAVITEPRLQDGEVQPVVLGSGTVKRAERWGAVAEDMAVTIQAPSGAELDLAIDDANNPPLDLTTVVVRFAPQPWIYFEAPSAEPLTATYGNARLTAPHYDLEASRAYVDGTVLAVARWSAAAAALKETVPEIPSTDTIANLRGAPVDRAAFRVSRPIPDAPAGLTVLLLDADVLARSRDLDDVRIVDKSGSQVPYLVEKRDEPLVVPLTLQHADGRRGTSAYRLELPYQTLPQGARLVLKTNARVFERTVTLRTPADERRNRTQDDLASSTWRATDPELLPPALTFDLPRTTPGALELQIDEGDNAPLPVTSAELLLPSSALRFHHPGTPLFLLYGNDQAQAPRYDLALLAPRLFGETARELTLAAAAPKAAEETDHHPERTFFWIVIALAAVVLVVMLAKLVKSEAA